jgi:hypothetical protein
MTLCGQICLGVILVTLKRENATAWILNCLARLNVSGVHTSPPAGDCHNEGGRLRK